MRLLFVHERIGSLGGAEANVLLTAEELRQRGHCVALAQPGPDAGSHLNWIGAWHARAHATPDFKLPNPAAER